MTLMPICMVGISFGLAMDYEAFIATRIREAHVYGEAAAPERLAARDRTQLVIIAYQTGPI